MAPKRLKSAIALIVILASGTAEASGHEVLLRSGVVTGTFTGDQVINGSYVSDVNLQAELWLNRYGSKSWVVRSLLANESGISRTRYLGVGVGQRYFPWTEGRTWTESSQSDTISYRPRWSFYFGWDVSVAQFLIVPIGVLSSYANIAEVAGIAGVRHPLSSDLTLDAMISYAYGTSLSSGTGVTTGNLNLLFGLGFGF